MHHSDEDWGFGCIILTLAALSLLMLGMLLLGRSTATREVIVENSNLTSYIEAAKKLKLDYKIEDSGDKKKIIISLPTN